MLDAPGAERRQAEIRPPAAYIINSLGQLWRDHGGVSRGRGTVSATEMVSLRVRRRSKTSSIRGRRLDGGNSDMVELLNETDCRGGGG